MKQEQNIDSAQGQAVKVDPFVMQDAVVSAERMREKAEALWCLLDDISTAGDMFKPDLKDPFVAYVLRKCEERGEHFISDGYKLFVTA